MYYPIKNQRFWILRFRPTGWHEKWFRGTGWREELVKKRFRWIGWSNKWLWQTVWCNKWLRKIGWHRKRPKKRSKQRSKGSYSHYQRTFNKKILISRFVPKIIPVVIEPVNTLVIADLVGVQDILSLWQTVLPKASVTDAARSCACMSGHLGRLSAQAGTTPSHGTSTPPKRFPGWTPQAQAQTLTPSP